MIWRFYRRPRICKGVSLNWSTSGSSLSLGRRGAHVTFGPRGTRQSRRRLSWALARISASSGNRLKGISRPSLFLLFSARKVTTPLVRSTSRHSSDFISLTRQLVEYRKVSGIAEVAGQLFSDREERYLAILAKWAVLQFSIMAATRCAVSSRHSGRATPTRRVFTSSTRTTRTTIWSHFSGVRQTAPRAGSSAFAFLPGWYGTTIGWPYHRPGSTRNCSIRIQFFGGSNIGNGGAVAADAIPSHGFGYSLVLRLPALAALWLAVP